MYSPRRLDTARKPVGKEAKARLLGQLAPAGAYTALWLARSLDSSTAVEAIISWVAFLLACLKELWDEPPARRAIEKRYQEE